MRINEMVGRMNAQLEVQPDSIKANATSNSKLLGELRNTELEPFPPAQAAAQPQPTHNLAENTKPSTQTGYSEEAAKQQAADARVRTLHESNEFMKLDADGQLVDKLIDAWPEFCEWDHWSSHGGLDQGELNWILGDSGSKTPNAFNATRELVHNNPKLLQELFSGTPEGSISIAKLLSKRDSIRKNKQQLEKQARREPAAGSAPPAASSVPTQAPQSSNGTSSTATSGTKEAPKNDEKAKEAQAGNELKSLMDSPMAAKSGGHDVTERLGNAQDAITSRWEEISKKLEDPNLSPADRDAANRKLQQLSQSMTAIANMMQLYMTMQQNLAKMYNDIAKSALNNIR